MIPAKKQHGPRSLSPRALETLAVLCRETEGSQLFKTQAVKLTYLVDVVAARVLGLPIVGDRYAAWDHGVVDVDVYDFLTVGDPGDHGPFRLRAVPSFEDRVLLELVPDAPASPELLAVSEIEIAEFVAAQYGRLRPRELGRLTKALNPQIRSWPSARRVALGEAYPLLPVRFDEVDGDLAREALAEAERDPASVTRGGEVERLFAEILG